VGKRSAKSGSVKSVPSVSRNCKEPLPLGKIARATRAVSSGTGSIGEGASDISAPSFVQMDNFPPPSYPQDHLIDYPLRHSPTESLSHGEELPPGTLVQMFVMCSTASVLRHVREEQNGRARTQERRFAQGDRAVRKLGAATSQRTRLDPADGWGVRMLPRSSRRTGSGAGTSERSVSGTLGTDGGGVRTPSCTDTEHWSVR
jgi:hypothetical protein